MRCLKVVQFIMVDDKPIMDQVHEYENLTSEVLSEGMKMCDILQANVLLEKFPPSWNDYRNQPKHKKWDLTLQELISHMLTEEANRLEDKDSNLIVNNFKANLIESHVFPGKEKYQNFSKKNKFQGKQKHLKNSDKKIDKPNFSYFICGKHGHKDFKCYQRPNAPQQKIKRLRSDRGGEYNTLFLKNFCEENGIIHEFSAPYAPQQN